MITRRTDWQPRFVAYIAKLHKTPFDELNRHCGYFVGDGIREITDFDPLDGLRGMSLQEMIEEFERRGFDGPEGFVASLFPEVKPGLALPADLALLPGEGGASFGFFQSDYIYAMTSRGIALVPREEARRAFAVGEELPR